MVSKKGARRGGGEGGFAHRAGSQVADGEQMSPIGIEGRPEKAVKFRVQEFGGDYRLKALARDQGISALEKFGACQGGGQR